MDVFNFLIEQDMAKPEAYVNRVIKNSFSIVGYKIPDNTYAGNFSSFEIKKPFDGLGVHSFSDNPQYIYSVYWEAKYSNGLKAFNLKNSLAPHQALNLELFSKGTTSLCFVILGVNNGRKDYRLYVFDWHVVKPYYYGEIIEKGKEVYSLKQKLLEKLPYYLIDRKEDKFNFTYDKFITKNVFNTILELNKE
jgi:hypothetical protein